MDQSKNFLTKCFQLIYVVTFPVQPEDEQQFQAPECRPSGNNIPTADHSDTKYSAGQPIKPLPSYESESLSSVSCDRGSKESESSVPDKSPIRGMSAEFSDYGLHRHQWPLANQVFEPMLGEQQIILNNVSDISQHINQQRQNYDQHVPSDSRSSYPSLGSGLGNHMQGFGVARDSEPFYDAVIVYDQNDFMEVQFFKEELTHMMRTEGIPDLRLEFFDSTVFTASQIISIEDIVRRSSLVLVYLTPQFDPNRLELFCNEIIGLTRLGYNQPDVLAGRTESTQKWAFRPVHTLPERARYYKTPIGLTTVLGMNWYDRYSPNTRQKIVSVMIQAINNRKQRENHKRLTSRYRELYMQHRNSDQGQTYANESFISTCKPGIPSLQIRPQFGNLYNADNARNGLWINSSPGVRTPVNPGFHQAPQIVRQSVPRPQVQSNGNGAQIMNMTRFQRPHLSMIPEQTLEQSGSFVNGQAAHPHVSTVPHHGMQHHNTGQQSISTASVDGFSIRSKDAYSIPIQHQLSTTRPQSTMSFSQPASLSEGELNRTDRNGQYCGRDQVSDRNISYQQTSLNARSNVMFHENLTGFTGQERFQQRGYIPDFTSNQCVGQPNTEASFKEMKSYQSMGSGHNQMGVAVVNGIPFQTARIDSNIGNGVSQSGRNIVQSASLSSQAIPVDAQPQFIAQSMQINAQTAVSSGSPLLSYQNMTSVVYPPIQAPQKSSFMMNSNSQAQIQDNFSRLSVSYPPNEYQQRGSVQIHAYQQEANPSGTPSMQMNVHQMSSVSLPPSHLSKQQSPYEYLLTTHTPGHQSEQLEKSKQGNIERQNRSLLNGQPSQQLFSISSSPSMQRPSEMLFTGTPSVRLDQPQTSLGNLPSNQMMERQATNNVNNIPCDSDRRYTSLLNSDPSVNKQNTQINGSGPASLFCYKSDDRVRYSDCSTELEESLRICKPFSNKTKDEIDINPNLSNDDLEIDKIPPDSGTFHQTTVKKEFNMNTSQTHDLPNTPRKKNAPCTVDIKAKQKDTIEEDDFNGKKIIHHHYNGYNTEEELDSAGRLVKNITNIWGSKNVQFGANSKVITYRNPRRRTRRDWHSSDDSSSDEEETRKQETQGSRSSSEARRPSTSVISLNIHARENSMASTSRVVLLGHQSSSEEDNCADSNLQRGIKNNLDASPMDKQPQDKTMNIQKVMLDTDQQKTESKTTAEATDSSIHSSKPKTSERKSNVSLNASKDASYVSGNYSSLLKPFPFRQMIDRDNVLRVEMNDISEVD